METHSDKHFWLKNYICKSSVVVGNKNGVIPDSDHFSSKCGCNAKLIRVKDKVSVLPENGCTIYHVTDNDVYLPAVFTVKAMEEACHHAEDILSQGSDDISHSVVLIQHYILEYVPDIAFEKSVFRMVIFKFKLYNRDGEFRSKISPGHWLYEPAIRRRAGMLWHENRESQSLADSSSHMSSAALTELLANLTSQLSQSSQEDRSALQDRTNYQVPQIMGAAKGHAYPTLGPFCAMEVTVSDGDAAILESYPEWQKGYRPPLTISSESNEGVSSSDHQRDQNRGQEQAEKRSNLNEESQVPTQSTEFVVGLTPDNLFASSDKNSEESGKEKDAASDQSMKMTGLSAEKSYQRSDDEGQPNVRKSLGSKSPAKSKKALERLNLIRGSERPGASDGSSVQSSVVTSKSPIKSNNSLARLALIRGNEKSGCSTTDAKSKSGSLGSSSSANRLSAVLDGLSKCNLPAVKRKSLENQQGKQKGSKEPADDALITRDVAEVPCAAAETDKNSSDDAGQKDNRSPRKAVGVINRTPQKLKETGVKPSKTKSADAQNVSSSVAIGDAAGSASGDKQVPSAEIAQGEHQEKNSGKKASVVDVNSEGFIVVSSESPEKSTEEIVDKHDKACQPEQENAANLASQCCQVGESLMFMTQNPRLIDAEAQVGASLYMASQLRSQDTQDEYVNDLKPSDANDDKEAGEPEMPTSGSSGKSSALARIGATTREFMEALVNSTIFSTPQFKPPDPPKEGGQNAERKNLSKDSSNNTSNNTSNSDKSSTASDFQHGQQINSSNELVPASGEERLTTGNEVDGIQVPFDASSQAREINDGQEKIELSCSDLSSPKELRYSGDSESTQRSSSKSSGRLSGSEKEFLGVTKSQDAIVSPMPPPQVMHSTQRDDVVSQQRQRLSFPLSPVRGTQVSQIRGQLLSGYTQVSQVGTQEPATKDKELASLEREKEVARQDNKEKSADGTSETNPSISRKTDDTSASESSSRKCISESEELISSGGQSGQITSSGDVVEDPEVVSNDKLSSDLIPAASEEKSEQNDEFELRLEVEEEQRTDEKQEMHKTPKKVLFALGSDGTKTPGQNSGENVQTPSSKLPRNGQEIRTPVSSRSGVPPEGLVSPINSVATPNVCRTPGVVTADQPCNSTPRDNDGARRRIPIVSPVEPGTQKDEGGIPDSQESASQQPSEHDTSKKTSPSTAVDIGKRYLEMMKNKETTPSRKVAEKDVGKKAKPKKARRLQAKDAASVIISELYGDQLVQTKVNALFSAAPPKKKKLGLSSKDTNVQVSDKITPKKPRMGLLQKNGLMLMPEHVEQDKMLQEQSVMDRSIESELSQSQNMKSSDESVVVSKKPAKGKAKKKVVEEEDTDDDNEDKLYKPPGTSNKKKKKKDQTPRKKLKVKQQLKGLTPKASRRLTMDASPGSEALTEQSDLPSSQDSFPMQQSNGEGMSPEDEQCTEELLDVLNENLTPLQIHLENYQIPSALTNALINDIVQGNVMELSL